MSSALVFFINACDFYGPSLVLYFCFETITHFAFVLTENVGLFGSAFKITENTFRENIFGFEFQDFFAVLLRISAKTIYIKSVFNYF